MLLGEAFDFYCLSLEAQGRSLRTIQSYQGRLASFLDEHRNKPLHEISRADVDRWLVELRRQKTRWAKHPGRPSTNGGLSLATIATSLQSLKTFFLWCVERDYLERSPAAHLKRISYSHAIEDDKVMAANDLTALLRAAKEAGDMPRDYALLLFFADTGVRASEGATLRLGNLYLTSCEAMVEGKTGRRRVYFTEQTRDAVQEWLKARPECDHDFVFVGTYRIHRGKPLTGTGIYQVFKRLARHAGIEGRFNPQSIRHLVGQSFVDHENLVIAQKKLGHRDITTTAKFYAHQDRERIKAATNRSSLLNRVKS